MKRAIEKSSAQVYRQLGLCLVVAVTFAGAKVRSQVSSQNDKLLPPPESILVPVHWPDITKLETDVREQLVSLQNSLAAAVKNPATSESNLSEAYGTMGELYQAYSLNSPARECYLNANSLAGKDFRWVYLLAKLDQQDGRIDEAIRLYRIANQLRPEYVAVPVNLGDIYLQLDRLDDAKRSFEAALKIEGGNAAAYYGLTLKRSNISKGHWHRRPTRSGSIIHWRWPIAVWETPRRQRTNWPDRARSVCEQQIR